MRYFLLVLIVIGSLTLAPAAEADKIVRWIDEQRVTHFGNRAPIDSNADVEEIDVAPTNSLAVPTNTVSQDLRSAVSSAERRANNKGARSVVVGTKARAKPKPSAPRKRRVKRSW